MNPAVPAVGKGRPGGGGSPSPCWEAATQSGPSSFPLQSQTGRWGGKGGGGTFMLLSPCLLGTLHSSTLSVMRDWWWLGGGGGGFYTLLNFLSREFSVLDLDK